VYFLKYNSEAFENFKKSISFIEKSYCQIKTPRTDKSGEFTSEEFDIFCEEHSIYRELTASYTSEQNRL